MQKEWNECAKATVTRQFVPAVQDSLTVNTNISPNFATVVTGHGKTRAYCHRLKIMEQAICPCNNGDQAVDRLLYHCTLLHSQRELLRNKVLKVGNWPTSKQDLTK